VANIDVQDQLVKELRLAQIDDIATGNDFLPSFVERFNERFAVLPAKTEDLHRQLNVKGSRLADILCHREQRHVGQQLTLAYDRQTHPRVADMCSIYKKLEESKFPVNLSCLMHRH
jgi:hypothetical protein